jgi:aspartate-semialdehyde dehydrogenase
MFTTDGVTCSATRTNGFSGVAAMDIYDNIVPFIGQEEEKMETETLKIMGSLPTGNRCLFVTFVRGYSRVPVPPAGMTPFITASPSGRLPRRLLAEGKIR